MHLVNLLRAWFAKRNAELGYNVAPSGRDRDGDGAVGRAGSGS
jgi:hypothetical protein